LQISVSRKQKREIRVIGAIWKDFSSWAKKRFGFLFPSFSLLPPLELFSPSFPAADEDFSLKKRGRVGGDFRSRAIFICMAFPSLPSLPPCKGYRVLISAAAVAVARPRREKEDGEVRAQREEKERPRSREPLTGKHNQGSKEKKDMREGKTLRGKGEKKNQLRVIFSAV
jgi:hypothetical protein